MFEWNVRVKPSVEGVDYFRKIQNWNTIHNPNHHATIIRISR